MENAAAISMFGLLLTSFLCLFGWTLSQTNKLSSQQSAAGETIRGLMIRIDLLVAKLDANFTIQINEQVARNVLQEQVRNLRSQVAELQRRVLGPERRRAAEVEEEDNQ